MFKQLAKTNKNLKKIPNGLSCRKIPTTLSYRTISIELKRALTSRFRKFFGTDGNDRWKLC